MIRLPHLNLADYQYDLPEERIARYPLPQRDHSKLLVFRDGKITHSQFKQLADFLPVNSTLFFNNTKVIPARLLFEKPTGGTIEVFLLNPSRFGVGPGEALREKSPVTWTCTVGNAKRWPDALILTKAIGDTKLEAAWVDRLAGTVKFSWTPADVPFAEIIDVAGDVPLPPYLKRAAEAPDRERYQTIYSKFEGAVAAPTAGLHFTPETMADLDRRGIACEYLTLHVSAGTFLPIKSANAAAHRMHEEEIVIRKSNIINLLDPGRKVIAVGTTALRSLESLYWFGVKLAADSHADFDISQELPYQEANANVSRESALSHVLARMNHDRVEEITGRTAIYVMPGYRFRLIQGLITNFHQPSSSLLVLVSALVGNRWKEIYKEALDNHFRFLSYGDSSLLLP